MSVECAFKQINRIEFQNPTELEWTNGSAYKNFYTCEVICANITESNVEIKSFVGQHTYYNSNKYYEGMNANDKVELIQFRNTTVECIPRNISIFFPQLSRLFILNCGLKEISKNDLVGLESLTTLCIASNPITTLPNDLLVNMPCLKVLTFRDNHLEFVDSQMLNPIMKNKLFHVDFRGNPTINEYYSIDFPDGSISLAQLSSAIDFNCKKPRRNLQLNVNYNFFLQGHKELWTTGKLSDFTIVTDSKEFKVHRTVLAARSSVFAAMFETYMKEQRDSKIVINDFSSQDVESFLKFFYFGCIENSINVVEVFKLAEKYDVKELRDMCEAILIDTIEENNAVEILELGRLYDKNNLKNLAFRKIREALPEKFFRDEWIDQPDRLKRIMDTKLLLESLFRESDSDT